MEKCCFIKGGSFAREQKFSGASHYDVFATRVELPFPFSEAKILRSDYCQSVDIPVRVAVTNWSISALVITVESAAVQVRKVMNP